MIAEKYSDYLRIVLIAYDDAIEFYERCGLKVGENKTPMFLVKSI